MLQQKIQKAENCFLWSNKYPVTPSPYYVVEEKKKKKRELPTTLIGLLAIINFPKAVNNDNFFF